MLSILAGRFGRFLKHNKASVGLLGGLFLVTVVLWWPTRMLPYWWDSAGYIMHAAQYYLGNNFSSFVLPAYDNNISLFAHPPLFPFLLALVWKFFGESLLVSHLFYLVFVFLAIFGVYLLGKEISKNLKDTLMAHFVGLSSALLLLISPLFLAHVGIIYVEIPMTAFALLTVYFFIKKNVWGYLIAGTLMLLMKEISVVVILAIIGAIQFQYSKDFMGGKARSLKEFGQLVKKSIIYSIPLLILAGWFVWHWAVTGWWFVMPEWAFQFDPGFSTGKARLVFQFFFVEQFRWPITVLSALYLFIIFSRQEIKKFLRKEQALVLSIVLLVPVTFSIVDFLSRYVIFGLAFLFIFFSYALGYMLRARGAKDTVGASRKVVFWVIIATVLGFFMAGWNNNTQITTWHFPPLEENVEYIDVIRVGKRMSAFVEQNYPDAVVYTSFPSDYMLSEPFQGYISKPVTVQGCLDYEEGDQVDLIVFHLMSPRQLGCRDMIQQLGFIPLEEGGFVHNGKWMQVYAPPSDTDEETEL